MRPVDSSLTSAATEPPAWTSPAVSTTASGAVATRYVMASTAAMNSAGTSVTNSCPSTVRFETPALAPAPSARHSPTNALLPRGASVCATGGRSTCRSLAESGGMRSGLSFASTMM